MNTLEMISEKWSAWRRYRAAVRELSQYSDDELSDIGICRCDIEDIVRRPVGLRTAATPHIVVVGGGVAGLILATRLGHLLGRRGLARVSLIDRSWVHVWKPMLHTFAAGTWNIYEQQVQFLAHARTHHFEYVPGQLDAIDRTSRRIRLAPAQAAGQVVADVREVGYDVLILAFGSRANDFSTPGVGQHCHFIDSQDQADVFNARLRAHVLRSFANGGDIDIAIVGGGATGVELSRFRLANQRIGFFVVRCLRRFATLLSLREQQLLAFLHILLEAPRYVFLERVGAVLGSDEVQKILQLLGESSITSINIGAADERRDLCDATLECIEDGGWSWTTDSQRE